MTDWYYKKLGSAGASGAIFDKDGNELISLLTPEEAKLILDLRESHQELMGALKGLLEQPSRNNQQHARFILERAEQLTQEQKS